MPSLLACAESGFEPIPGYVLRQRLGAGGYGEVWLADAPGGLKKAIKFVFGSLDEDRASRELKALNRIRQVNHPFLLSLERIEVVDGQLLIVTELADGCLHDRYKTFCEQGAIGIPRDQLLDYLRDAADALDFLCQKHDLQHLDVKPANMLLVADRVKVADFGLVKDVQSNSMSMMGGMTPIYAAPEMFDGRPGRFSDQYSLAIVYQELLTGSLPFGGRTTAQLASEHLHRAPNLDPVPPADRPILIKALSKKPNHRFASCREFIDQLAAVGRAAPVHVSPTPTPLAQVPPHEIPIRPRPQVDPHKVPSTAQSSSYQSGNTSQRLVRDIEVADPITIPTIPNYQWAPALFLGIGGTGADMLTNLRAEMTKQGFHIDGHDELAWLLVDTDSQPLQQATSPETCGHLDFNSVLHIPLKSPQYYRDQDEYQFSPISRRWLYNVPRSKATEGIRPLAMLALLDHAETCHHVIVKYLQHLTEKAKQRFPDSPPTARIYLLASAHGATGGGIINEFAFLIRNAMDELGLQGPVQAIMTVASQDDRYGHNLQGAAAMSCLNEISHYVHTAGLHPGLPTLPPSHAAPRPPFDAVYLVQGGVIGDRLASENAIDESTLFVFADALSPLGSSLDTLRTQALATSDPHAEWTPWLRTLGSRKLDLESRLNPDYVATLAMFESIQNWLQQFSLNQWDFRKAKAPKLPSNKKVLEQIDFMISDLFRTQRWTAQAFVARCTAILHQDPNAASTPHCPSQWLAAHYDQGLELELDRIASQLGIDVEQSRHDANAFLDESLAALDRWLTSQTSRMPVHTGYWHTFLAAISQRFVEQGSGLQNVAQRLRKEHDDILDQMHQPNQDLSTQQAIASELDRLEIQARLHEIAGMMLVRMGLFVDHHLGIWLAHVEQTTATLRDASSQLAEQLDLRVDAKGLLVDNPLPLPKNWGLVKTECQSWSDPLLLRLLLPNPVDIPTHDESPDETSTTSETTITPASLSQPIDLRLSTSQSEAHPTSVSLSSTPILESPSNSTQTVAPTRPPQSLAEVIEASHAIALTASQSIGLEWHDRPTEADRPASTNIAGQMSEANPPLLQWGGTKRCILLLPACLNSEQTIEEWKSIFESPVSIGIHPNLSTPLIVCEGDRLSLGDLQENLWMPTSEKSLLASRLHTRVDVDWIPLQS